MSAEEAVSQITLTINGTPVTATEGTSVLDAARSAGIEVPTLCHVEELTPYGACRLCLVEIKRGNWSKMVVSCLYPVEDGLEVETENERVAKHRKIILELLSARWEWLPEELMQKYGADKVRFDKNTTFCVLCGLCVRHCAEVRGDNVLGFVGRGTERQVVVYPEKAAKACPGCGGGQMECLELCPTGVISSEFSVLGLAPPGKKPLAYPIAIKEDENLEAVKKMVGDT